MTEEEKFAEIEMDEDGRRVFFETSGSKWASLCEDLEEVRHNIKIVLARTFGKNWQNKVSPENLDNLVMDVYIMSNSSGELEDYDGASEFSNFGVIRNE
ncbi:hypothetical protein GRX03_01040 [Halovenus sp. WSH3]|uniref:Uncharacterized protein n=1 Tax=Halovenus carboxidivorans TaxID=2692199 RepID=A0A6B0T1U3_9EURY|nr:hypothetical protein [Halovenus carboxidivorans]MXR50196.1 hypothetical protein [Halovenus carboxidivorans]